MIIEEWRPYMTVSREHTKENSWVIVLWHCHSLCSPLCSVKSAVISLMQRARLCCIFNTGNITDWEQNKMAKPNSNKEHNLLLTGSERSTPSSERSWHRMELLLGLPSLFQLITIPQVQSAETWESPRFLCPLALNPANCIFLANLRQKHRSENSLKGAFSYICTMRY